MTAKREYQHDVPRTVVVHIKRRRRIVLVYPIPVVQEPVREMRVSAVDRSEPPPPSLSHACCESQKRQGERKRVPNARHLLAHLGGISPLKLAQLCISLDFEKYFVPRRGDDLCAGERVGGWV